LPGNLVEQCAPIGLREAVVAEYQAGAGRKPANGTDDTGSLPLVRHHPQARQ
jgi:hypothetical protein